MFDPGETPRLFATPIGVDFGRALVAGLEARLEQAPPEAWGEVTIYVNTTRMKRHLRQCFAEGPPRLMPDLRLVTSLAEDPRLGPFRPATPSLRLRLELREAVLRLIELQPDLAPRAAAFDLATSLAALLDELHGEGVDPAALAALDVADHSAHWARSLKLISILFGQNSEGFRGNETLNRDAAEALTALWRDASPKGPVLVAGSTGSRGTTRLVMEAVARLPQGAVILPGFDFAQPPEVWQSLIASTQDPTRPAEEDHPQFRFADLMARLGLSPDQVSDWAPLIPADPARNKFVSLALRPAPVTDQWRRDGPALASSLADFSEALSLIEAPTPRHEADAIALALRGAVEAGKSAALVTPDRTLARQVSAALRQWEITPDDSAGLPLHQSAPGRFLIETAALFGQPLPLARALSLLKHPLTASAPGLRGPHLLTLRGFETWARGQGIPQLTRQALEGWLTRDQSAASRAWAEWIAGLLLPVSAAPAEELASRLDEHIALAEALAAGPEAPGSGALWETVAGEEAVAAMNALREAAPYGGRMENSDYAALIRQHLSGHDVRSSTQPHPRIAIWGTIEARTQLVDLCILAGLNEGTWPATPAQDPWMNRAMRRQSGMLAPERRIGLAAHDFQQALGAPEVILSRSARDAEAESVPARWLNRITNLLGGLGPPGERALEGMRARGNRLLAASSELARTGSGVQVSALPAPRPSPAPPAEARPRQLFVTSIATLIRDPYAIYARHVLGLRRLGPLSAAADPAMRGTVLHAVMERALRERFDFSAPLEAAVDGLCRLAREVIDQHVPWPATARIWQARFAAIAPALIVKEADFQALGIPVVIEKTGSVSLANGQFRVLAKPDRIDLLSSGGCAVFDYKSGTAPPSEMQVENFDKQLLIEAAIAELGGFDDLGARRAERIGYICLGRPDNSRDEALEIEGLWRPRQVMQDLAALIHFYDDPDNGYTARRAPELLQYASDYDHLSRFGEWDDTSTPERMKVGQ